MSVPRRYRRRRRLGSNSLWRSLSLPLSLGGLAVVGAATCSESFALVATGPLVVQQPPAHKLLVVVPVRRTCCSDGCEDVAHITYFTATSLSSVAEPARPSVDFVDTRGVVSFGVGQEEVHFAVEVLSAVDSELSELGREIEPNAQRVFAVVVQAAGAHSSSMEIIVTPARPPERLNGGVASTVNVYVLWLCIVGLGILAVLAMCSVRRGALRLPRRPRAFEYKVLLMPRKRSGSIRAAKDVLGDPSGDHGRGRRKARRGSVSKNWRSAAERRRQDLEQLAKQVYPALEEDGAEEQGVIREVEKVREHEDENSEDERELRAHLALIQVANGRRESCR